MDCLIFALDILIVLLNVHIIKTQRRDKNFNILYYITPVILFSICVGMFIQKNFR